MRHKRRLHAIQIPVDMMTQDVVTMPEEQWQLIYGPIFGTRERQQEVIGILYRNRRPFFVTHCTEEVWQQVQAKLAKGKQ